MTRLLIEGTSRIEVRGALDINRPIIICCKDSYHHTEM